MASVTEIIEQHHDEIVTEWTAEATRSASARGLPTPEFNNIIPSYLTALGAALRPAGPVSALSRRYVEDHVSSRLRQGFHVGEVVEEFALLGRCIARRWADLSLERRPDARDIERMFSELSAASAEATDIFQRHLADDEQTEKRYLRQLQTLASEALEPGAPNLRERLKNVLELVLDAVSAQTAAVLLYEADSGQLITAASAGAGDEMLEHYATSLSLSSFPGKVAGSEVASSEVSDAQTTSLEISPSLRRAGMHSLLGVRLGPHLRLQGVLYVGRRDSHQFSSRDRRLLESFGDKLALHLDNATLYADGLEQIRALREERALREHFVSVLAHDLRGPLSAARMAAFRLAQQPELLDERRDLGTLILRNIDRTDRMVTDLLDANRIRAGERLPLRLAECDLAQVAAEVLEELRVGNPQRLDLIAPTPVRGVWSADELRRALWNLASNAIKYGDPSQPVTVTVRRMGERASAAVHNDGPPIAPADQQQLFKPFARTRSAQLGPAPGWGLGLTLVWGCAQAHGGQVQIESETGRGTTFTLELPLDSRPFQPQLSKAQGQAT